MKNTLEYLFDHHTLTRTEAKKTLTDISSGLFNPYQVSAFLTIFRMRGITVDELAGFRDALQELCVRIDLDEFNATDLCGTGGDGKDTFNISTLAAFVTAGAGVNVAKHGNYAVSSSCGSSNVMEYLGYHFTDNEDKLKQQIDACGICFLHAPLFHPAMKEVAPIRKSIGVRTFFNMLGPMVNPSFPKKQMVGVYSLELLRFYHYLYEHSNIEYRIVHSLDGYDEISLTADCKVVSPLAESIVKPTLFTDTPITQDLLFGGTTVKEAADIFVNILDGNGTTVQNNVVAANAAIAIQCSYPTKPLDETFNMALEALTSGKAKQTFEKLIAL